MPKNISFWKILGVIAVVIAGIVGFLASVEAAYDLLRKMIWALGPITVGPAIQLAVSGLCALIAGLCYFTVSRIIYLRIREDSPEGRFERLTKDIKDHRIATYLTIANKFPYPDPPSFSKQRESLGRRLKELEIPRPNLKNDEEWLPLRTSLVESLGEKKYRAIFMAVIYASIVLIIWGFVRADSEPVYQTYGLGTLTDVWVGTGRSDSIRSGKHANAHPGICTSPQTGRAFSVVDHSPCSRRRS